MTPKEEVMLIKKALKKSGILATVHHGTGTARSWIDINLGKPQTRNGIDPNGNYTSTEIDYQNKALKIAQFISNRHGDYDGRITVLTQ